MLIIQSSNRVLVNSSSVNTNSTSLMTREKEARASLHNRLNFWWLQLTIVSFIAIPHGWLQLLIWGRDRIVAQ